MNVKHAVAVALASGFILTAYPSMAGYREDVTARITKAEQVISQPKWGVTYKVKGEPDEKKHVISGVGQGFLYGAHCEYYVTLHHVLDFSKEGILNRIKTAESEKRGQSNELLIPEIEIIKTREFITHNGKGTTLEDKVVNSAETDLAVVRVNDPQFKKDCKGVTEYQKKDELYRGQRLFYVGNPRSVDGAYKETYVSRIQDIPFLAPVFHQTVFLGTDTIPGDSGSPIFDEETGKLVGVIQYKFDTRGGFKIMDAYLPYLNIQQAPPAQK